MVVQVLQETLILVHQVNLELQVLQAQAVQQVLQELLVRQAQAVQVVLQVRMVQ